ncbi:MAG: EscU/YscU/HrcU family type III secretion system export apparatus switch protein, partial [Novosphingobium sp.]
LAGAAWLKFAGPWLMSGLSGDLKSALAFDHAALDRFSPGQLILHSLLAVLPPVLVLGVAVMAAAVVSQLGFGEGRFMMANLAPKASRINPASGLKRMFGSQGLVELSKSLAKAGLLGVITWTWARGHVSLYTSLPHAQLSGQLALGWGALTSLLFALSAGLVVVALIDFPIQWLRRHNRLLMSHQDMRDENKESEGSPENKQAIRQRQRQLSRGGLQTAMREAQFVITNPTHFSVAMAYDPDKASAPIVLAKGRGEKALAMREMAAELSVPMLEYPALARSVFFTTRENQVIREELYAAVAGVLAFVFALKRGEAPKAPAIDVPVELRFDPEGRPELVA